MRVLVKMLYGSRIFGTALPSSDADYKGVFLPDWEDLALHNSPQVINVSTGDKDSKNGAEDVDEEWFELGRFLGLCTQGQTVTLDMLFCPPEFWIEADPLWEKIRALTPSIINRDIQQMMGYATSQAGKYSAKGDRLGEVEETIRIFEALDPDSRLSEHLPLLNTLAERLHSKWARGDRGRPGSEPDVFFEVCNRKMGMTTTVAYSLEKVLYPCRDQYGARAKAARDAQGADWKALYHAVRICEEGLELLRTGRITIPRPEAPFLLEIRQGFHTYEAVSEHIADLLDSLALAVESTKLPEISDHELLDKFVLDAYKAHLQETVR